MPQQSAAATSPHRAKSGRFSRPTVLAAAVKGRRFWQAVPPGGWPLVLLLVALATLFPAFVDSGPLHRPDQSFDHITHHHLAVAKNLSLRLGLLGFYRRTVTNDDVGVARMAVEGAPIRELYNRFPPLGYILIRLAIATQGGDLAGEIQTARMLMLALFAGAAVLAYLAVDQLTGRPWLALAATLAAFSSYAALRTCDMVATEGTVDLFGTMLVFHGIARYRSRPGPGAPLASEAKPRLGQLLAKTCVALLLGWHVVGLVAPFVVLGLAAAGIGRNWAECRRLALFGALAFLFALAILAQNFAKEYIALQGHTPLGDLPSFRSMLYRSTLKTGVADHWPAFLRYQLHLLGLAFAPYAATQIDIAWLGWSLLGCLGVVAIVAAAVGLALASRQSDRAAGRQTQTASLALLAVAAAGPVYAMGMRGSLRKYRDLTWWPGDAMSHSTFNGREISEAVFLVGLPLAVFSLWALLAGAAGWRTEHPRRRPIAAALVAALWATFVASSVQMGRLEHDPKFEEQERALFADLEAIQRVAAGKRIFAPGPVWLWSPSTDKARKRYYFTDNVLILQSRQARFADFAVGPRLPQHRAESLTPDNRFYFLYPIAAYFEACAYPVPVGTSYTIPLDRWCENH